MPCSDTARRRRKGRTGVRLPIKDDIDGGSAFVHGGGSAGMVCDTMIGDGGGGCIEGTRD